MILKQIIVCLFGVLFCYSCVAEVKTYPTLFKASKRLVAPYGVCTHINRKGDMWEFDTKENDLAKINGLGVSFIRTDFDWGYCQPNKSKPNSFVHHDNMMEAVCNQKLDVLGIFSSPRSRTDKQWDVYVADVVGHYQSSVKYWEVINEADLWHRRQSNFTPEDYVSILKTAYPIIKKENRKAKVLFSGISNVNMGFIEKVFEQNVADYFDIMNIHWYANKNNEPESFFEYFEKLHSIMNKYHVKKNVWLTETGCTTASGYADEDTQARRLPRIFLISYACGIDKVFWYKSRSRELTDDSEDFYGLWHKDYQPKPVYYAYKMLVGMCPSGSTRPQITRIGDIFMAKWKQPKGQQVTALWTSKGTETFGLNSVPANVYDIMGNKVNIQSNAVTVSPSVIYLLGKVDFKLEDDVDKI